MFQEGDDFDAAQVNTAKAESMIDTAQANVSESTYTAVDPSWNAAADRSAVNTAIDKDGPTSFERLVTFFIYTRSFASAFWLNYVLMVHRIAVFIIWVYSFSIFAYNNPAAAREIVKITASTLWNNIKLAWLTYHHGFWSIGGVYNYVVIPTPLKKKRAARGDDTKTAKSKLE